MLPALSINARYSSAYPSSNPTGFLLVIENESELRSSLSVNFSRWLKRLSCRMVPIGAYYLGSPTPQVSASFNRPQSMSQASLHQSSTSSLQKTPTPSSNRASMPLPQGIITILLPRPRRPQSLDLMLRVRRMKIKVHRHRLHHLAVLQTIHIIVPDQ